MTNTHKFTITLTEVEHERLVRLIAGRIERDQPKNSFFDIEQSDSWKRLLAKKAASNAILQAILDKLKESK
jgi:hypothetical protein